MHGNLCHLQTKTIQYRTKSCALIKNRALYSIKSHSIWTTDFILAPPLGHSYKNYRFEELLRLPDTMKAPSANRNSLVVVM